MSVKRATDGGRGGRGTRVRVGSRSPLRSLVRQTHEPQRPLREERRAAPALGIAGASRAPSVATGTSTAVEGFLADRAEIAVHATGHVAAVLAAAGALTDGAEDGRVAERAPEERQADVDALMNENPVEVFGIDIEVRRRELDRRPGHASASAFDDGTTGAAQAPIPPDRYVGPFDLPKRPRKHACDRVEGAVTFQQKRRRGDHG